MKPPFEPKIEGIHLYVPLTKSVEIDKNGISNIRAQPLCGDVGQVSAVQGWCGVPRKAAGVGTELPRNFVHTGVYL